MNNEQEQEESLRELLHVPPPSPPEIPHLNTTDEQQKEFLCQVLAGLCDQVGGEFEVSFRSIIENQGSAVRFEPKHSRMTVVVTKQLLDEDRKYLEDRKHLPRQVKKWAGFQIDMMYLVEDQAEWSRAVFGPDEVRGPLGPLKHLAKEVQETIQAIENGDPTEEIAKEFADLLILFLDSSRRAGFTFPELVIQAIDKMRENRARKWQIPTKPDEPVEHVRD